MKLSVRGDVEEKRWKEVLDGLFGFVRLALAPSAVFDDGCRARPTIHQSPREPIKGPARRMETRVATQPDRINCFCYSDSLAHDNQASQVAVRHENPG